MSIPVIIFALGALNTNLDLFSSQMYILTSILLLAVGLGPWIIALCIKISLKS
mgnify:FL=1